MKIAICVKEVPDPTAEKRLDPGTNRLVRSGENTLNPYDRHAIEAAVRIKEVGAGDRDRGRAGRSRVGLAHRRQALAQGGDRSVHLADDGLAGSDVIAHVEGARGAARAGGATTSCCSASRRPTPSAT